MPPTFLAIGLALASALATALGMVLRHNAAEQPHPHPDRAARVLATISDWRWSAGTFSALLGFVLLAVAFHFGSLLLVQPITVLSLMFTLPLSARLSQKAPRAREWLWASTLTLLVGALLAYGRPIPGSHHPLWWQWVLAVAAGLAAMAALIYLALSVIKRARPLLLGIAGGIAFAYVAVFAKGVVNRLGAGGALEVLRSGEVYGMIAAAVIALYVQQASFASGRINQAAPASTATTPVVSIALGLGLLGERFSVSALGMGIIALIIVAMAANTVLLARAAEY